MTSTVLKMAIIFISFIGMFAMRYIPFVILGEKGTSKEFERFIKYIPIGVFVALIVKDIFFKDGNIFLSLENIKLLPMLIVIAISIKFKNIGLSVVSGGILIIIAMLISSRL
ncbi:MAG: AzlD domain-containing protein [Peptostreptococcus sp.]|uniref:AzlD domain-containing protein n=1 Tax=Peptostreptococcus sp. TaxID=1262 RepID=UPI002FC5BB5F